MADFGVFSGGWADQLHFRWIGMLTDSFLQVLYNSSVITSELAASFLHNQRSPLDFIYIYTLNIYISASPNHSYNKLIIYANDNNHHCFHYAKIMKHNIKKWYKEKSPAVLAVTYSLIPLTDWGHCWCKRLIVSLGTANKDCPMQWLSNLAIQWATLLLQSPLHDMMGVICLLKLEANILLWWVNISNPTTTYMVKQTWWNQQILIQ